MKSARLVVALVASAPLFACHVDHDGSFEHDAGFVAASASVAVQIGHPPPAASTADAGKVQSPIVVPIGPQPPR